MCYVIFYTHAECLHNRKFEIIENCEEHCEDEEGTCILIPLHYKEITAPSLCVSCFRAEEAEIDALYQGKVAMIRSKIAEYEAAQTDRQIRGRARGAVDPNVARLERDLVEARELRDREIRNFRDEQDVWGDG